MAIALYQLEGKLSGELLDAISSEATTASIRCRFFDSDSKSTARIPDAATLLFAIDPENTQAKTTEWILATSHSTTDGVTTLVNVIRGLQRDNTINLTGSATRANDWDAGTPIGVNTIPFNDNVIKAYLEGTEPIPGNIEFDGDITFDGGADFNGDVVFNKSQRNPVFADATARDAAIPSPTNGMEVYNTAAGEFQDYTGGAWVGRAAGSTPNASETVAGKVEIATAAEGQAGTDIGGTGAFNVVRPSEIAKNIQNSQFVHAVDASGTDDYAITLTPAVTSLVDGQVFVFEAGTANTGASTLNVNALGAKAIKKNNDVDTATGDIEAGQKIVVCYDQTNDVFQMLSPTAVNVQPFEGIGGFIQVTVAGTDATGNQDTAIATAGTAQLIEIDVQIIENNTIGGFGKEVWEGSTTRYSYFVGGPWSTTPTYRELGGDTTYQDISSSGLTVIAGSGGNTQTYTFSIQNLTSTGFDLRVTNTRAGGGAGLATINIGYKVWT